MAENRIHIFGPAGAGTTALGIMLSDKLSIPHFDVDAYYWIRENDGTLYKRKRNPEHRKKILSEDLEKNSSWVLSGSLCGWGDDFIPSFTLVVYLFAEKEIRLERIREREKIRYGENRVGPGGDLYLVYLKFLKWAGNYDEGGMETKSRIQEEEWMKKIQGPYIKLNGVFPIEQNSNEIVNLIRGIQDPISNEK